MLSKYSDRMLPALDSLWCMALPTIVRDAITSKEIEPLTLPADIECLFIEIRGGGV